MFDIKKLHSSFWIDDNFEIDSTINLINLSRFRRGIAQFIKIKTGRDIPVTFSSGHQSYTNSKRIVILSRIKNEEFDAAVGLALHEAKHITDTDFDIVKNIKNLIPNKLYDDFEKKFKIKNESLAKIVDEITGWIEDRRNDFDDFKKTPGYKKYYMEMYKKYFHDPKIKKILESDKMREENWRSYKFRIYNLLNKSTDLKALKGLEKISKILNLKKIDRLTCTKDSFLLALEIWKIVFRNIDSIDKNENIENENEESDSGDNKNEDENYDINKILNKQKDFINGKVKRKKISDDLLKKLKNIEESKTHFKDVGNGIFRKKTQCIVVEKLNMKILKDLPLYNFSINKNSKQAIDDGILLGKKLAAKLSIRNEINEEVYTRKSKGKIDKRLIYSGTFNDKIFKQVNVEKFTPSLLHISVDASSSMEGEKWKKALTVCISIAKAFELIENADIIISFRMTKFSNDKNYPLIIIAYDSQIEKINKIKTLFPYFTPDEYTPEGLTYESIMEDILKTMKNKIGYFLNLSDGEPYIPELNNDENYYGNSAFKHTKKEIDILKGNNIKVLSFFISENNESDSNKNNFKKMYGNNASFIDVGNLTSIAYEINELFTNS